MKSNSSQSSNQPIISLDATSAELDRLGQVKDKAVKKAVALHPNTSPETLIKLSGDRYNPSIPNYLEQVLQNPTLPIILLEQPDFLNKLFNHPCNFVHRCTRFPLFFINWAVHHGEASVRSAIARNEYIPIDCLVKLSQDVDSKVRRLIAETICVSDEAFERYTGEKAIDRTAHRYPDVVYSTICQLAKDPEVYVRCAMVNSGTPIHIIEQLSLDKDYRVRCSVARSRETPIHIIEQLSNNSDIGVLGNVAGNSKSSEAVLRKLFKHESEYVAEALARNRNLPVDLMEIYVASENKRVLYAIADNQGTPADILTKLAASKNRTLLMKIAHNPNTPPEIAHQCDTVATLGYSHSK